MADHPIPLGRRVAPFCLPVEHLSDRIRGKKWGEAAFIILILVTVDCGDGLSRRVRQTFTIVGGGASSNGVLDELAQGRTLGGL